MIVSIHIPKTAGSSLRELLKPEFGERLMLDYGDWAGFVSPEAIAHRAARTAEMRGRRNELLERYDIIHGHFVADKYADLFPLTHFVAFFRDPYQQAVSNYLYLQRNPQIPHPLVTAFHDAQMTLHEYVKWDATSNPQTQLLGRVPVDSLAMVGLTEEFARSLVLFNATFARRLSEQVFVNVNPSSCNGSYEIDADLRKVVDSHRAADVALYRRAKELFASQVSSRGV